MMKIEGRTNKDLPLSQAGVPLPTKFKEAASSIQQPSKLDQNLQQPQIISNSGSGKSTNQNSNKALNIQAASQKKEGPLPQQQHKHKSKSAQHQHKQKKRPLTNTISAFDKLEEARYKSYETHQALQQLVNLVDSQQHQQVDSSGFVTLTRSTWSSVNQLCQASLQLFTESSQEWDSLVEKLASEVNEYKVLCH